MNAITLNESVLLPDNTRTIELQIKRDGVRVLLDDLHGPSYDTHVVMLGWGQVCDVELLAARFDTETVRVFKVLVEMLGKVYTNKNIYDALV
jgi:hypothetical protein